jgi:hypothetical protein
MAVTFGLERLLEDEIAISVEGDDDVLVPRACSNRKTASVMCVQPAEGVHFNGDLIGQHILRDGGNSHSAPACRVFLLTNDAFELKHPFKSVSSKSEGFRI